MKVRTMHSRHRFRHLITKSTSVVYLPKPPGGPYKWKEVETGVDAPGGPWSVWECKYPDELICTQLIETEHTADITDLELPPRGSIKDIIREHRVRAR